MRTSGRLCFHREPGPLLVAVRPQHGQPSWRAIRDARCDAYAMPSQHALVRKGPQQAIADLILGWKTLVPNTIDVSRHCHLEVAQAAWAACMATLSFSAISSVTSRGIYTSRPAWRSSSSQPGLPRKTRGDVFTTQMLM